MVFLLHAVLFASLYPLFPDTVCLWAVVLVMADITLATYSHVDIMFVLCVRLFYLQGHLSKEVLDNRQFSLFICKDFSP